MSAHGIEKVEGTEGPSVRAGACRGLGVRKSGAYIYFGVYAPTADKVWLVGSFNDWDERDLMKKGSDGIWRIRINEKKIPYGTAYKYKVYAGDDAEYIPDPYTVETDGVPYHNSVYRDTSGKKPSSSVGVTAPFLRDEPFNVYKLRLDRWICDKNGLAPDYVSLGRELLPYILQMGYSHIVISGMTEKYYDLGKTFVTEASFVVRSGQGGADFLESFIERMHSAGIGVLVELGLNNTFSNDGTDIDFYTDNALYWLEDFSADGIFFDECFGRKKEFLTRLVHNIKINREGTLIAAVSKSGIKQELVDVMLMSHAENSVYFRGMKSPEEHLCARAAAMTCLLLGEGRMLTRMGDESAQSSCAGDVFERALLNDEKRARFQLFCSELSNIYLTHALYERGAENADVDKKKIKDRFAVKRLCDGEELAVFADTSGQGSEICVGDGEWHLILDSVKSLGIGKQASVCCMQYKTVLYLPPYGAAVLKKKI